MEDDTRQPDGQQPPRPKGPANSMPGGTAHTAGGTRDDIGPSYFDVVRNLGPEYYLNFHKRPCVRDGQLTGIGAGFVGGSLAMIIGKPVIKATNIAVLTWAIVGCGSYQYCQYQRGKEKEGMQKARELMEKKRATIEARKEARRKRREQEEAEEARRLEEERKKSLWRFKFW